MLIIISDLILAEQKVIWEKRCEKVIEIEKLGINRDDKINKRRNDETEEGNKSKKLKNNEKKFKNSKKRSY